MEKNSQAKKFIEIVGKENVFTDSADLYSYSYDGAVLDNQMPAVVVRPRTSEELGACVKFCNDEALKLTVRGGGTNLTGGTIPLVDGVVILTNGMQKILEINEADMYAVVEPGVITADFAAAVAKKGLFYPPDPGSQAVSTIAGNVAENAGGLRGLKYGVTKDYVMGLEFWDVTGNLIQTGSKTVKCATGYNLTGLMVGSEGTLGVFDKITLKLIPPVRAAKSLVAIFSSVDAASETVAAIIANKIVPATLEFMDNFTIRTVENFRKAGLPIDAEALLLIEVDGHPVEVEEDAEKIEKICKEFGATKITVAKNAEERARIWQARRDALPALASFRPTCVLEDATVPRSKIPHMMKSLREISEEFSLTIGTFGHAGDGNLHPTILCDKRDAQEWERVEKGVNAIFDRAIALGGTLSGEHGIGLAKSKFMTKEVTAATIEYSLRMKRSLDPKNILNPGKIVG